MNNKNVGYNLSCNNNMILITYMSGIIKYPDANRIRYILPLTKDIKNLQELM